MKFFSTALLAIGLGSFLSGCNHLDLTPPASADRVLVGVVSNSAITELPANGELSIRVMDVSRGEAKAEVLGEQTIHGPAPMPVHFRIEYRAEDPVLMHGVNVDARISIGGRLRYTTISAHPVTLGNVNDSHVVEVALAAGH